MYIVVILFILSIILTKQDLYFYKCNVFISYDDSLYYL